REMAPQWLSAGLWAPLVVLGFLRRQWWMAGGALGMAMLSGSLTAPIGGFAIALSAPLVLLWRTHSCVPGRDSSRPTPSPEAPCDGMSAGAARTSAYATRVAGLALAISVPLWAAAIMYDPAPLIGQLRAALTLDYSALPGLVVVLFAAA